MKGASTKPPATEAGRRQNSTPPHSHQSNPTAADTRNNANPPQAAPPQAASAASSANPVKANTPAPQEKQPQQTAPPKEQLSKTEASQPEVKPPSTQDARTSRDTRIERDPSPIHSKEGAFSPKASPEPRPSVVPTPHQAENIRQSQPTDPQLREPKPPSSPVPHRDPSQAAEAPRPAATHRESAQTRPPEPSRATEGVHQPVREPASPKFAASESRIPAAPRQPEPTLQASRSEEPRTRKPEIPLETQTSRKALVPSSPETPSDDRIKPRDLPREESPALKSKAERPSIVRELRAATASSISETTPPTRKEVLSHSVPSPVSREQAAQPFQRVNHAKPAAGPFISPPVTPPQRIQERIEALSRSTTRDPVARSSRVDTQSAQSSRLDHATRGDSGLIAAQRRERAAESIRLFNGKIDENVQTLRLKADRASSPLLERLEREFDTRVAKTGDFREKSHRAQTAFAEPTPAITARSTPSRENGQVLSVGRQDGSDNSASGKNVRVRLVEGTAASPALLELRQVIATLESAPKSFVVNHQIGEQLRSLLSEVAHLIDARMLDRSRPITPQEIDALIPYDRIRKLLSDAALELSLRERLAELDRLYEKLLGAGTDKERPLQELMQDITDLLKDIFQLQEVTPGKIPPDVLAALGYGVKETHETEEELELELDPEQETDSEQNQNSELEEGDLIEEERDIAVYEIYGRITDMQSGAPIPGAILYGGLLGSTTTDADGYFRFHNVTKGTMYIIGPDKEGYEFNPVSVSGTMSQHTRHDFRGRQLNIRGR